MERCTRVLFERDFALGLCAVSAHLSYYHACKPMHSKYSAFRRVLDLCLYVAATTTGFTFVCGRRDIIKQIKN